MRNTKIICTIGPASLNELSLLALREKGLSVVRLNGSHANLEWHAGAVEMVRRVIPNVPILLDIPGRKIRTNALLVEPIFNVGDVITLTTDEGYCGVDKITINYANLHNDLSEGDCVMADDGRLKFTVVSVNGRDIHCKAETAGQLGSRKGINVPYVSLNTPQVTNRDKDMIEFAVAQQIDFIGLSFVESTEHILKFRSLVSNRGPRIIAKIENLGGLKNAVEIASAADAIMIDRGDLSVETSLFDIPRYQKEIIKISRRFGKPVIIATEMLHSMTSGPAPTKAEVTDIANAVIDGCSATMLSGETAIGDFSVEAVEVMGRVIDSAEDYIKREHEKINHLPNRSLANALGLSIDAFSRNIFFNKIVILGASEDFIQMIAEMRLSQPLIVVTDDIFMSRCVNLLSGAIGVYLEDVYYIASQFSLAKIFKELLERNILNNKDQVLLVVNNNDLRSIESDFNISVSLVKMQNI